MPKAERSHLQSFTIIPVLGRKTDVPPDSPSLFQEAGTNTFLTHDVGGLNFDLVRKTSACTKSKGSVEWDTSANAQATRCLGLFELESDIFIDHIFFDNGKFYVFNHQVANQTQIEINTANLITFANYPTALYSMVRVGPYIVFSDSGDNQPYKWKHYDATLTQLAQSGTQYKTKYLMSFQRRVIYMYILDETNGDISVRWSTPWPTTAIENMNFPASNQLYIPNDDTITGGAVMGNNNAYVYCKNSIQQLIYTQDYAVPFRMVTIVPFQGLEGHHSLINLGDRHYFFNRHYGFVEYHGGATLDHRNIISKDIDADIQAFNKNYYHMIYGTYLPLTRQLVWAVPHNTSATNSHLYFYNLDSGQWTIEDKLTRCIDTWRIRDALSWTAWEATLYPNGYWEDSVGAWPIDDITGEYLVHANTDGHLYYQDGEDIDGANIDGYRIEPIGDFGDKLRKDQLKEIWFDLAVVGAFKIHVYHRSGDTVGEVEAADWTTLPKLNCNSPENPVVRYEKTAKLHQIKWRTDKKDEKFQVTAITFKYLPGVTY